MYRPASAKKAEWQKGLNRIWLILPLSVGVGMLLLTWVVYVTAWLASVCADARSPLFYGNLVGFFLGFLIVYVCARRNRKGKESGIRIED